MNNSLNTQTLTTTPPFSYYNDIQQLIFKIYHLHKEFSNKWLIEEVSESLNLNKKQVRNICTVTDEREVFILENDFYSILKKYTTELEALAVETDLDYFYQDFDLRLRVKQNESIINKLKFYQVAKEGKGRYALNKCLNDLLGFRIIIKGFDHTCQEFDKLCNGILKEIKIKKTNSSKGDYKATHLYFYGVSNRFYPWELQIWNPLDSEKNEKSHALHKQEYKKWAEIYKHSNEISER